MLIRIFNCIFNTKQQQELDESLARYQEAKQKDIEILAENQRAYNKLLRQIRTSKSILELEKELDMYKSFIGSINPNFKEPT